MPETPVITATPAAAQPTRPAHRGGWAALRQDAWRANWGVATRRAGLLCLPVIAAWVCLGVLGGRHEQAVLGIAGAVAVGFGAFQSFGRRRLRWMFVTLVGIVAATW